MCEMDSLAIKPQAKKVRQLLHLYPTDKFERVELTEESTNLADTYILEKVVGQTSFPDCLHIALATINQADLLVSWNFKHIVNIERIRGYNSINIKNGYKQLEIRSPRDLMNYGN